MDKLATLLSQLRDIESPPPVSWWPPAIGWWLLLGCMLLAIAGGIWLWRFLQRKRQRRQLQQLILQELQQIEASMQAPQPDFAAAMELSILLRRLYLTSAPNRNAAGIIGEPWLAQLSQCLSLTHEEQLSFHSLLTEPYRAQPNLGNLQALLPTIRERLRHWP